MTLVFHKGVNSIRANKFSAPVPTRCLLFLVTNGSLALLFFMSEKVVCTSCLLSLVINGNLTLVFDMELNSIGAYKLSAIVSRILKKKRRFHF